METNFAHNYVNGIKELEAILLQPHIDLCKSHMGFSINKKEDSVSKVYYRDDDEDPCCKISYGKKGIIFYEKNIQTES